MEFANSSDFTNYIKGLSPTPDCPNLCSLVGVFLSIHQGCQCSQKTRINNYNNVFTDLPNKLTITEKDFLKIHTGADIIKIVNGWEIKL